MTAVVVYVETVAVYVVRLQYPFISEGSNMAWEEAAKSLFQFQKIILLIQNIFFFVLFEI